MSFYGVWRKIEMDKTRNKKTGNLGEDRAAEYLISRGYKILERNLRLFCGEIDILASPPAGEKNTLVIVEVKTVRGAGFGLAQDLVRHKKQQKLITLGRAIEQQFPGKPIRIDVIGVNLTDIHNVCFEHLENAIIAQGL